MGICLLLLVSQRIRYINPLEQFSILTSYSTQSQVHSLFLYSHYSMGQYSETNGERSSAGPAPCRAFQGKGVPHNHHARPRQSRSVIPPLSCCSFYLGCSHPILSFRLPPILISQSLTTQTPIIATLHLAYSVCDKYIQVYKEINIYISSILS